jgi:hypothetical protein
MIAILDFGAREAPPELQEFVANKSFEQVWFECPRSDWMLWLLNNKSRYRNHNKILEFVHDLQSNRTGELSSLSVYAVNQNDTDEYQWMNALCIAIDYTIREIVRDVGNSAAFVMGAIESAKALQSGKSLKDETVKREIDEARSVARNDAEVRVLKEQADDLRRILINEILKARWP